MLGAHPHLRLAVSLAGLLAPRAGATTTALPRTVRDALDRAAATSFRGVALDATVPSIRPRDLDRSARRDLAASLRRAGLASAGVDLWIPPEHFTDARHVDRALAAAFGALELASDLAALTEGQRAVSMTLPTHTGTPPVWRQTLESETQRLGVCIADCAWPPTAADPSGPIGIGIGIDPALALAAGEDPGRAISRAGPALAMVRIDDWNGTARVPVGRGRLDTVALAIAVATSGYTGFCVTDLRGTPDPLDAAERAVAHFGAPRDAR